MVARQVSVDPYDFQAGPHVVSIDKGDGTGNSRYELILHIIGVDDFRLRSCFRAKNLRDPKLFELRFRHLVDDPQHNIAFPGHRGTDQQDHGKFRIPVLPIAEKHPADFGKT